jgi:hypothetical protein
MTATYSSFDASTVLGFVKSESNPNKKYKITRGANGHIYCDCPAWRFQKGKKPTERTCKHLRALASGRLLLAE